MVRRFYLEGRTVREIATLTGISHQMVSAHVRSLIAAGEIRGRRRSA